jgi:hypothetical protein
MMHREYGSAPGSTANDEREARTDYYRRHYEGEEERLISEDLSVPHLAGDSDRPGGVFLARRPTSWGPGHQQPRADHASRDYRIDQAYSQRDFVPPLSTRDRSRHDFDPPVSARNESRERVPSYMSPTYRLATPQQTSDESTTIPARRPNGLQDSPPYLPELNCSGPEGNEATKSREVVKEEGPVNLVPSTDSQRDEKAGEKVSTIVVKQENNCESPVFLSPEDSDVPMDIPSSTAEDNAIGIYATLNVRDNSMTPIPFERENPASLLEVPDDLLQLPISSCGPHDDKKGVAI